MTNKEFVQEKIKAETNQEYVQRMSTDELAVFLTTSILSFLEPIMPKGVSEKKQIELRDRIFASTYKWLNCEHVTEEKKNDQN